MNLTGELVIANARLAQLAGEMSPLFRRGTAFKKSKELTERLRQRFEELRGALGETPELTELWTEIAEGLDDDLAGLDRQSELWEEGSHHFADVGDAVDQLTRVSKNLQRGVLNTRMVPVGPLFNRFMRVIRDLSLESRTSSATPSPNSAEPSTSLPAPAPVRRSRFGCPSRSPSFTA
jgi:two-component system chemotaxis sensor kinase CheA